MRSAIWTVSRSRSVSSKRGTVQIGNEAEFLRHGTPPFLRADRQDFEEQLFESVEILQRVRAEKGVAVVPVIPGDEPPLEEFQEENPVDPGDAELQGGAEGPLVGVAFRFRRGCLGGGKAAPDLQHVDRVFQQRAFVPFSVRFSPDELPAPLPDLIQADDVEEFVIEFPVQGVAVVGEGKLQQMWRREEFEEGQQLPVPAGGGISHKSFAGAQVDVRAGQFDAGSLQKGAHDLPVEGVGSGAGEAVALPVAKLPDQPLVAVKITIEIRRVEDVPFIDVAGDQPGQAEVSGGTFPEVVEDQFVQRLGIGAGSGNHLRGVGRVLRFDDDGDGVAGGPPRVDDQVGPVFRVDFADLPIPDLREEIGDDPFQVLLGLALIDPVEQPFETLPE